MINWFEEEYEKVEKSYPGFYKFLSELQVGRKIKFYNLFNQKEFIIQIVFREEIGVRGRAPGCGCIEYANISKNGKFTELHKDGYFPCQTFLSIRDWYKYSNKYEIIYG